MFSQIVEDLNCFDNTRNQLNDNTFDAIVREGIGEEEEDADGEFYEDGLDYNLGFDVDYGVDMSNTDPIAERLNLDYPLTTNHFKKHFEDSSLPADPLNTISPILTINYNFFQGKNDPLDSKNNDNKNLKTGNIKNNNTKYINNNKIHYSHNNNNNNHSNNNRNHNNKDVSVLGLVGGDILGIQGKQNDLHRDPLISSVAGSISSSSYSLDLSSDQLSPGSILSSIDLKSFNPSQSDLDKEITNDNDQRPVLQSMATSSSFLISNDPPVMAPSNSIGSLSKSASPVANYVKQPRQGRYSASRKSTTSYTNGSNELLGYSDSFSNESTACMAPAEPNATVAMNAAGPGSLDHNRKVSDSRLSAQGLAQVLKLDSPEEALKRERYILDIFENELHYPLGYKTWVRDTSKEFRVKLIDELHDRVKTKYPEYDHAVLETIIRRATYYMMQSRLRRERRAKAKGLKSSRSTASLS